MGLEAESCTLRVLCLFAFQIQWGAALLICLVRPNFIDFIYWIHITSHHIISQHSTATDVYLHMRRDRAIGERLFLYCVCLCFAGFLARPFNDGNIKSEWRLWWWRCERTCVCLCAIRCRFPRKSKVTDSSFDIFPRLTLNVFFSS